MRPAHPTLVGAVRVSPERLAKTGTCFQTTGSRYNGSSEALAGNTAFHSDLKISKRREAHFSQIIGQLVFLQLMARGEEGGFILP